MEWDEGLILVIPHVLVYSLAKKSPFFGDAETYERDDVGKIIVTSDVEIGIPPVHVSRISNIRVFRGIPEILMSRAKLFHGLRGVSRELEIPLEVHYCSMILF